MATPMSDDELRAKLKELGEDIGPVTDSTRILWRKKLDRLLADRKNQRRKVEASSSSVALSLIQYSSDDSESDVNKNALDRPVPRSRRRTSNRFASDSSSLASQEKTLNISSDGDFKKPTGIPKSWRNTKQSSGLSPGHQAPAALPRLARPSLRSLTSAGRSNGVMPEFESSDSDIDEPNNRRSTRSTRRHRSTPADEDSVATSGSGSPYPGMRGSKRSESSERSKLNDSSTVWEDSLLSSNHVSTKVNGYNRMDATSFTAAFRTEESLSTHSNMSQWISMILLAIVTLFFVCIAILYVRVRHKEPSPLYAHKNFNTVLCDRMLSNQDCIYKANLPTAITLSKQIDKILRQTAGAFECKDKNVQYRHLTYEELKAKLREQLLPEFNGVHLDSAIQDALLLIRKNPSWGIRLGYRSFVGDEDLLSPSQLPVLIKTLEATSADKSLPCRFMQALKRVVFQISMALLVITGILGLGKGMRLYRQWKDARKKQVYAMVEKIIDFLQKYHESCQNNHQKPPYIAVLHIRDMFIPPSERRSKQWLWEKAVQFLEENESRVRVEQQSIEGEEYKVWRWLQPTTPEGPSKKGKVWQGQAFGSSGKMGNHAPYAPAPCLKIRNMFDPDVEYGDRWPVMIEDAILEKCEGNDGIVHIKVDTTSKEGCVYVKCKDAESAGQAYKALHGWWFDRKLVTVKYLRLERYHERFPESCDSNTPLKPSNNMRLSLSEPFHSSALERS